MLTACWSAPVHQTVVADLRWNHFGPSCHVLATGAPLIVPKELLVVTGGKPSLEGERPAVTPVVGGL